MRLAGVVHLVDAGQVVARGGLGLAKPVYDAMLRMQEPNPK